MFVGAGPARGLFVGTVRDWVPGPGRIVSWQASPASLEKARHAPISDVPLSAMQEAHLRGYSRYAARGLDYARLVIGSGDEIGRCDIRAMNYVINAHLRRHKTYHSRFVFEDAERIVRHTIEDPADIEFLPIRHSEMSTSEWQEFVLSTPDPVQWDCFRFGVIQRADHFTFFAIVDHLHCDPTIISGLYAEIVMNYRILVTGGALAASPPPASHDDFCLREKHHLSTLSLASPEVRKWIEFAENNGGTLPDFPLPLGDLSAPTGGGLVVERLMNQQQTAEFESLCTKAGARVSGGLFACVALAQYELTGATTYYGLAPTDNRRSLAEFATMGWFTGVVPFTVPVQPASFQETTRAAQESFDANLDLAKVSFNDVLKMAPWLREWGSNCTMVNYMDTGLPPFSATIASHMKNANIRIYCDPRDPAHLYISVIRLFDEVSIWVNFPNNPVARDSVTRYLSALKSVLGRVVDARHAGRAMTDITGLAYADDD
ncbi:acyltransferase [Mycobacterium mantenii]|uniref:Acyltransferase n=1 Tax=Mycobacterium mantenii TaxID=560555 RepID=A0A1A2SM10_MYCNT|nr:acyltransferase [Mycobacterium mantenii]OBH40802.1 acyltransferase [Mycobacterium mantenii]OBH65263.1 acyltransferase [Mycobacterium mantenii]OBH73720.1 acyltransferase [Mycobacterium mantenii]